MSSHTQNIYDNTTFFTAYSTLPRSQGGLSSAPEWPVLRNMVLDRPPSTNPKNDLTGQCILDLGCGYGWFARWARDSGGSFVRAVDISEKMIGRAKEFEFETGVRTETAGVISFGKCDIESMALSERERGSYDVVHSSLTFHYIEDLPRLYREIHAALRKGGRLVFSVEHPVYSAPVRPGPDWKVFQVDGEEMKAWPLNCYSDEGWRVSSWLGVDGVRKFHRTVESYVTLLLESGFVLTGLKDWVPSMEDVSEHPEWKDERHRPYFLIISAEAR
ncbi:Methyltransferase domain protein [Aspergillus sclerotialis]|uniref:Methyltransferase domain protein n=1 Tax=Aspergillus sclerotialis TaxID=2070753 RepID=A0A3A2ZB03_9EURO|nr:Methyltransferase domain protein [Aspergillus sclerotialis]